MVSAIVFLLFSLPPAQDRAAAKPATQPANDASAATAGAMRVELATYQEVRGLSRDAAGADSTKSEARIGLRLLGARLGDVRRIGNPVFAELVDDNGQSLIDASTFPANYASQTRRPTLPSERVRDQGLALEARVKAASRSALTFSKARGSVRVIYAGLTRGVYFDNPRQLMGQPLQDQTLTDLGVEIVMLPVGDPPQMEGMKNYVALRIIKGAEKIHGFEFCDPWLRPMRTRQSTMPTKSGDECEVVALSQSIIPQNTLVIDVYPSIEDVTIPIQLDGLKLP